MMLLIVLEITGWCMLVAFPVVALCALRTPSLHFLPELSLASHRADHADFDALNAELAKRLRRARVVAPVYSPETARRLS